MYTIAKSFKFDAAHQLLGLPEGHKCGNVHGHTYTVTVTLASKDLTKEGWVHDFGDFKAIKEYIDTELDHKFLNGVVVFQTTSENLAKYLFDVTERLLGLPEHLCVYKVRVSETESTWAEYSR